MVVIAILGLLIPGYALARALRSPVPWAVAFPLSALLLAEFVIAYTVLGVPLRFGYVLAGILAVTLIALAAGFWRKGRANRNLESAPLENSPKAFVVLCALLAGLVLFVVLIRATLTPLSGPDAVLRWDALPRLMLQYEGLSYYPPLTSDDFAKYFVPDGFPPLVASVYWWLYAGWGSAFPRITAIAVWLQVACCFALVYYAVRLLFGTASGWLSVAVLACTSLFVRGVMNGQENGFIALCYAGQLLFAFAAAREPEANLVVIAGLFAGLGALAREYGPLLSLSGFAVLACHRGTRRFLPLFCLVSAAVGAPWYIRNWMLTGNPIYSLDTGLGLPVNPVLAGIRTVYHENQSLGNYSATAWLWVVKELLIGAPVALLLGLPGIAAAGKARTGLGVAALVAFLMWFWSIPNTAGGMPATWRFLTPAWIVLSIAAGAFGPAMVRAIEARRVFVLAAASVIYLVAGGYAIAFSWSLSTDPSNLSLAINDTREDPIDFFKVQLGIAKALEDSKLPALGVLTEDGNLAVALQRYTRFRPVMIWNPDVAFVFNPELDWTAVRRQLIDKHISLVAATYFSLNNNYLKKFPFYKELFQSGKPLLSVPEALSIIYLPEMAPPSSDANVKP